MSVRRAGGPSQRRARDHASRPVEPVASSPALPVGNAALTPLLRRAAPDLTPTAARSAALQRVVTPRAAAAAGNRGVARLLQADRRAASPRSSRGANPVARRSPIVQRDPSGADAITPTSIGTALAGVKVERETKQQVSSLRPWEMFAYVPWNPSGGAKKRVFQALSKAHRSLDKATATVGAKRAALAALPATAKAARRKKAADALAKAEANLTKARAALPTAVEAVKSFVKSHLDSTRNPQLTDLKAELAAARKKVKKAGRRAAASDRTLVTTLEAQLASRLAAMRAEIDAADYAPAIIERTTTTWAVGDARATVYDKVEAYATVTASGLEGKAALAASGGPTVDELLAKDATLSASTKRILGIISEFEGHFSSLNTWDIADVTWGMVQWTTGAGGKGDLIRALQIVKADEPAAFDSRLRRYGIDVADDGLVLTRPDGTVLRGLAAAKALQGSAQLSAVLAASGADPKIQVAQLKAAYDLEVRGPLSRAIQVTCADGKKSVKVADVVTSEAGVGALANQTVHGGYPAGKVVAAFNAAAKAASAKKADPVGGWRADAERRLVAALRQADPERVAIMVRRLDTGEGTFR